MEKLEIKQTTWNLNPLFKSDNDPAIQKERNTLENEAKKFIKKWKDRDDYLKDPKVLAQALKEYENWVTNYGNSGKQGYYFGLRSAQDQTNPKIKAEENKLNDLSTQITNDMQFFLMNIAKIPPKEQSKFLNYKGLKDYKHMLKREFIVAKHLLSDPEEKIVNLMSKTSYSNWVRMLSEFLSKEERSVLTENGKKTTKTFADMMSMLSSKRSDVRKSAAYAIEDILGKHLDVAETEFNTVLENKKISDKLREYNRPDTSRHLHDDINSSVVDALIGAVSGRYGIPKKFYRLKSKLLKIPNLKYFERSIEYGETDKKFPYQKAVDLVFETLNDLDSGFADIFKEFVSNGQIDIFPRKGKRDGAFCAHSTLNDPTYILLNHTGKLNDVLTIAHETGHGINNELIKKTQNELNFGTPLSTAEVASTFMEDFVLQRLLKEADDEERLSIMMHKLDSDIATIFRQIAFYKFEQEIHEQFREQGYLTSKQIGKLFKKHMQSYMGPVANGSENWWLYVSHFRSPFYVYSYSSGELISKALQALVKKDPKAIKKVKVFLSTGLSDSPKNIFKKMGIDITKKSFWDQGLDEVEDLLKETTKLAKKLGKI